MMTRSPDTGRTCLCCCVLLTTMASVSSEALHTLTHPAPDLAARTLELDREVRWREADEIGTRCFAVHLPSGTWWIEVASSVPATTPELLLFAPPRESSDDATPEQAVTLLERVHSVMVSVHQPGDWIVCLTSQVPLGDVRIRNVFVDDSSGGEVKPKDGDPRELELEEDP